LGLLAFGFIVSGLAVLVIVFGKPRPSPIRNFELLLSYLFCTFSVACRLAMPLHPHLHISRLHHIFAAMTNQPLVVVVFKLSSRMRRGKYFQELS